MSLRVVLGSQQAFHEEVEMSLPLRLAARTDALDETRLAWQRLYGLGHVKDKD